MIPLLYIWPVNKLFAWRCHLQAHCEPVPANTIKYLCGVSLGVKRGAMRFGYRPGQLSDTFNIYALVTDGASKKSYLMAIVPAGACFIAGIVLQPKQVIFGLQGSDIFKIIDMQRPAIWGFNLKPQRPYVNSIATKRPPRLLLKRPFFNDQQPQI